MATYIGKIDHSNSSTNSLSSSSSENGDLAAENEQLRRDSLRLKAKLEEMKSQLKQKDGALRRMSRRMSVIGGSCLSALELGILDVDEEERLGGQEETESQSLEPGNEHEQRFNLESLRLKAELEDMKSQLKQKDGALRRMSRRLSTMVGGTFPSALELGLLDVDEEERSGGEQGTLPSNITPEGTFSDAPASDRQAQADQDFISRVETSLTSLLDNDQTNVQVGEDLYQRNGDDDAGVLRNGSRVGPIDQRRLSFVTALDSLADTVDEELCLANVGALINGPHFGSVDQRRLSFVTASDSLVDNQAGTQLGDEDAPIPPTGLEMIDDSAGLPSPTSVLEDLFSDSGRKTRSSHNLAGQNVTASELHVNNSTSTGQVSEVMRQVNSEDPRNPRNGFRLPTGDSLDYGMSTDLVDEELQQVNMDAIRPPASPVNTRIMNGPSPVSPADVDTTHSTWTTMRYSISSSIGSNFIPVIPEAFLVEDARPGRRNSFPAIIAHAEPLLWVQKRAKFLLALVCVLMLFLAIAFGVLAYRYFSS